MEKLLNSYDKQSMKMAILKHEETFKEQVLELHRLYQVQKMLMKNMKRWESGNKFDASDANYINEKMENEGGDGVQEIEDENAIELTLGPARYRRNKKDETRVNSIVRPCFSSSSTESSFIQRTSTKTLNRADRREEFPGQQWGVIRVADMHSNEQLKQERLNHPPWHFQVLSLNMT